MRTRLSERQRYHYEKIIDEYDRHYYDEMSSKYRDRFIYDELFGGLNLDGKRVADLAAGSGHNSMAILGRFPKAEVFGVDISEEACVYYERNVGQPSYCRDLTSSEIELPEPADIAIVIGGLHHCVADLGGTLSNVAKILKPGGRLLMAEPNAEFFLNSVRILWYRYSHYFDDQTECPLVHDQICELAKDEFAVESCRYMGGASYVLVLNSMIIRTPLWLKKGLYHVLLGPELLWNKLGASALHPYFLATWVRKAG